MFIDVLILAFVLLGLFIGFFKGVVKVAVILVAFYLSVIISSLYFRLVAVRIAANSSASLPVLEMLSFFMVLVVAFLIFVFTGLYAFRYVQPGGRLQYLDKVLGTVLGLVLGVFIACIFGVMMRYLFITQPTAATLDFPAMRFLQGQTQKSVTLTLFTDTLLPLLYAPISPLMPESADRIFRAAR